MEPIETVFSSRGSASGDNNYEPLNDFFPKNLALCASLYVSECTSEHLKLLKFPERALPQTPLVYGFVSRPF